jgi:hypothetical protein
VNCRSSINLKGGIEGGYKRGDIPTQKPEEPNFITPDRRDILVPPMLEAGLDLQQAPPIDSTYQ